MTTLNSFQTMCSYNQWMNEKLYGVCETIPDATRKADKGAFFHSIHGTLNHLLLTDKVWLGRFKAQPFLFRSLDQELYSSFAELRQERFQVDAELSDWINSLSDEQLALDFSYTNSQGQEATYLLWHLVLHLFNHQTHHRGQLTTLLNQSGYDSGVTDLLVLLGDKASQR